MGYMNLKIHQDQVHFLDKFILPGYKQHQSEEQKLIFRESIEAKYKFINEYS